MSVERWLPIEGFPGYEVSDLGRVRSWKSGAPHVLATRHTRGYRSVTMRLGDDRKTHIRLVHRLVAKAFLSHPTELDQLEVNHKNGVKSDNQAFNLEWSSHSENIQHSYGVLGQKQSSGAFSRLSRAVIATHVHTGEVLRFPCMKVAEKSGFSSGAISDVCNRKRGAKTHKDYRWNFLAEDEV